MEKKEREFLQKYEINKKLFDVLNEIFDLPRGIQTISLTLDVNDYPLIEYSFIPLNCRDSTIDKSFKVKLEEHE